MAQEFCSLVQGAKCSEINEYFFRLSTFYKSSISDLGMWHQVVLPKLDQKYSLIHRDSFISKHSLFTVLYNVQYCKREGLFTDEVVLTD
jgi:hypothetical protein